MVEASGVWTDDDWGDYGVAAVMIVAAVRAVTVLEIVAAGSLVSHWAFHHAGAAVGFSGHTSAATRLTKYGVAAMARDGTTVASAPLAAAS